MSKGPGKVERAIIEAFRAAPDGTFTTAELIAIAFGHDERPTKAERVSVLRAIGNAAKRLYEAKEAVWDRGYNLKHEALFYNHASATGRARAHIRDGGNYGWPPSPEQVEAELAADKWQAYLSPGEGLYWASAEIARATMLGVDPDPRAAEVQAASSRRLAQSFKEINAAL